MKRYRSVIKEAVVYTLELAFPERQKALVRKILDEGGFGYVFGVSISFNGYALVDITYYDKEERNFIINEFKTKHVDLRFES